MSRNDEPVLGERFALPGRTPDVEPPLAERIRRLVEGEPYGILCTQGDGQPYGSMVAFAADPDLTGIAFATPINTRKFRLLTECDRVALVVDNRPRFPADMMGIEAVTVTGRAQRLASGPEFDRWATRLLARHAYLESFVAAVSCALFRIDVVRYFHVARFQEVREWIPLRPG